MAPSTGELADKLWGKGAGWLFDAAQGLYSENEVSDISRMFLKCLKWLVETFAVIYKLR